MGPSVVVDLEGLDEQKGVREWGDGDDGTGGIEIRMSSST